MKKLIIALTILVSFTTVSDTIINKHKKTMHSATIVNYTMISDNNYLVSCELSDGNIYSFYSDTKYLTNDIILIMQDDQIINAIL